MNLRKGRAVKDNVVCLIPHHILLIVSLSFLIGLVACSSRGDIRYSIECVHPAHTYNFKYDNFTSYEIGEDIVSLREDGNTIYYSLPAGSACIVQPQGQQ